MPSSRIAIIGAGIGGLAAAIALRRSGFDVGVYEQAAQFRRIGAAINLAPNAVRAVDGLALGDAIRDTAFRPTFRVSRTWDTGEETSRIEMGKVGEARYGAPQLTLHRADLLSVLEAALPADSVHLGKRLVRMAQTPDAVTLEFADSTTASADAVIGADGIHSTVREALFGPDEPRFTGMVAFRSIVPAERLAQYELGCFTKWWGPTLDSQIVTFLIDQGRELFVFATKTEAEWTSESWSSKGEIEDLRATFAGYHAEATDIIAACDEALKTALHIRDPLPHWSMGRATLLGDACHPMVPFMAQGAAMGLEDAVVLVRCLRDASPAEIPAALQRYERTRLDRTARIQRGSSENDWLRIGGNADAVYGFDAWSVPLA